MSTAYWATVGLLPALGSLPTPPRRTGGRKSTTAVAIFSGGVSGADGGRTCTAQCRPRSTCPPWTGRSCTSGARTACSPAAWNRSEEHTSELQSQSNLVCRLLLEKKKNHLDNARVIPKSETVRRQRRFPDRVSAWPPRILVPLLNPRRNR